MNNKEGSRDRWLLIVDDELGYQSLLSINVRRKTDLEDDKVLVFGSGEELLAALPELSIPPHAILVFLLDGNFSKTETSSEQGLNTAKKIKEIYGDRAEILNTSKMVGTVYDQEFPNKVDKQDNVEVIEKVEQAYADIEQKLAEVEKD